MKKKINLYRAELHLSDETRGHLFKVFENHRKLSEKASEILKKDPETDLNRLKELICNAIEEEQITPVVLPALYTNLYYQVKKAKYFAFDPISEQDIQYITIICSGYYNNVFQYYPQTQQLGFFHKRDKVTLTDPLPSLQVGQRVYVNISYASNSGSFMLTIYEKPHLRR